MRVGITIAALAMLTLAACGTSETPQAANQPNAQPPVPQTTQQENLGEFGPACAAVPTDGAGSFAGMAMDPVAVAASNNPALKTLVAAVKQAGLVDTLNGLQDVTVFAPTDEAFAKIPKATLDQVLADKAMLTKILTYHVVPKALTPADLASGTYETVQKATLTTSGSGEMYKVNDANVVCGNVKTANATVYIIDTVLMPM